LRFSVVLLTGGPELVRRWRSHFNAAAEVFNAAAEVVASLK
jgi:hypothetical protein